MTEVEVALKIQHHDDEIGSLKHRVDDIESEQKEIGTLVRSVDKLATSVETLAKEQQRQGKRLECIEQRPIKKYDQVVGYVLSSVVSCLVGGGLGALLALIFK